MDPEASAIEMDRFIVLEDGRKVNIEIDGPHQYVLDGNGQPFRRLADIRRDEILEAMGIEVYRISYEDLEPSRLSQTED
ncbi:MAG: hypothetical protein AAF203_10055, partial [Pseudomonadota bacterium]